MMTEKLFTIGPKDFRVEYFRGSGAGGQKRNKTSSACRITHIPSGAVGECQEERTQSVNKKRALQRLTETSTFQSWLRVEAAARIAGYEGIEKKLDNMMKEENLLIETYTPKQ